MLLTFGKWRHVHFWGILVFHKKVFPFSGGATGDGSGAACPFLGHSCFQHKCFPVFRGCNRRRIGCGMSLFGAFMFSIKRFCRFQGVPTEDFGPKWPKMAQNCRIIYAHVPFWAILILKLNVLPFGGHATLCSFS
jgi:hypothetical protein